MIYTPELIKEVAPSIFATSYSDKLSNKYAFVPTDQVIEFFDREGWKVSSVRQNGKGIHALHEVKFRNNQLPNVGDTLVEAIVRNSHNGTSGFSLGAGLYRLVCSNGLVVPTSVSEKFNIRHKSFTLDEVKELTESFSKKLPKIETSVSRMMQKVLTTDEQIEFVEKASKYRWATGSVPSTLNFDEILTPNRVEDNESTLWNTFNVVQEKFVRGGVGYKTKTGRTANLRSLKNIVSLNYVNTKLWETAESML
jgi:hypothetical protein